MTCNCIDEIDKQIVEKNGKIELLFTTTGNVYPVIQIAKINTRGKRPPFAIPTFCPFCGVKYRAEQDAS